IQFAAPPPPIASSVLLERSQETKGVARKKEKWRPTALDGLESRERALQAEVQALLDAQSAGLVQGLGGDRISECGSVSGGSSTPTSHSIRARSESRSGGGGIVPVRQPKRRPVGLRGARRGLLRDMGELAVLKTEGLHILDDEIVRREDILQQVSTWESRIAGAREKLNSHNSHETGESELEREEAAVDNEIQEMEERLQQLRNRKRMLGQQREEAVNKREARLSSYRGALRETEAQVREFLKRPPVLARMSDEDGFYTLHHSRRTLGMAREWWEREAGTLRTKREETSKEKDALEEGAGMWQNAIEAVNTFEDELRAQMAGGEVGKELFRGQIKKMGDVIGVLGGILDQAQERGWNL
ncbi:hypothetical protein LSUE1_G010389, partial [Lachnellula suecica]